MKTSACAMLLFACALLSGCQAPPSSGTATSGPAASGTAPTGAGYESRGKHRGDNAEEGGAGGQTPGQFDYYLLTLSWSPEYCYSHRSAPECAAHPGFVLHGLWPENNDGTYPEHCSNVQPPDLSRYGNLYPDPRLAMHEWQTHGTCSGLSPDSYFQAAGSAFQSIHIPAAFTHLSQPLSLAPDEIVADFAQANPGVSAASLAVSCTNRYLSAVQVCLDKNLHATSCGAGIHRCNSGRLNVPPPES